MHQGPAVLVGQGGDVDRVPAAYFRGQDDEDRGPALLLQQGIQVFEHQQIPPQPLAGHQAGHVGEDQFRTEVEQGGGVVLQLLPGALLVLQGDIRNRNPVVHQIDGTGDEFRAQETQLLDHPVADRQHGVAAPGLPDQAVLEKAVLGAEHLGEIHPGDPRRPEHIVEHHVVARALLHQTPHRGHFVGVKHGEETPVPREHGLHRRAHAHELVGDQENRSGIVGQQGPHPFETRFGQAQVLLVLPEPLIGPRIQAEVLAQIILEQVQSLRGPPHIHEQHLGMDALLQPAAAVDQPRTPLRFHCAQGRPHPVRPDALGAVVEHVPVRPQGDVRIQQGPQQDGAVDLFGVTRRGDQALQDRPDPAGFLHRLVGNVNHSRHGFILICAMVDE